MPTNFDPARWNRPGFYGGGGGLAEFTGATGGTGTAAGPASMPVAPGAAPGLSQVTNLINSLNRTAQQSSNAGRIPGATDLEGISSANIRSELQGELPAGVVSLLRQQAAERGVAGGFGGSPNETAGFLRALGLTSLDLTGRGQSNLTAALGRNPGAPIWDPSKMVLGPGEAEALTNQRRELELKAAEIESQNRLRDAQARTQGQSPTPWWVVDDNTDNWSTWIPGAAGGSAGTSSYAY